MWSRGQLCGNGRHGEQPIGNKAGLGWASRRVRANLDLGGATRAPELSLPNGNAGFYIIGNSASGNVVQGNKVGTDISGLRGLGTPPTEGIYVESASTNTLGGGDAGGRAI